MLKSKLIHPEILSALSKCGHGDTVLLVDGNYPLDSESNENAEKVYLGLEAGVPTVPYVLSLLKKTVNIESMEIMSPNENEEEPEIFEDIRETIPALELKKIDRFKFYEKALNKNNLKLAISTGDYRDYGCLILTIGTYGK